MKASEWNAQYPIGTEVLYFPVLKPGVKDSVHTKTRSEAWELGGGHPVVALDGFTGGKSVDHLLVISVSSELADRLAEASAESKAP